MLAAVVRISSAEAAAPATVIIASPSALTAMRRTILPFGTFPSAFWRCMRTSTNSIVACSLKITSTMSPS